MFTFPNAIPCEVTTGGVDTAHIGLYIKWKPEFKKHLEEIMETQKRFKAARKDSDELPQFAIENYFFEIKPYGYNPGGSKHCYYPVVLECGGIRFCLSEREIEDFDSAKKPNVRIEMGSLPLMCYGFRGCYDIVRSVIRSMGGNIRKNRLSRIDVCADIAEMDIANIQRAVNEGRFICKARKKNFFVEYDQCEDGISVESFIQGRRPSGVTIGKSKILCRIYEKMIESRRNEEKLMALMNHRWGMDHTPENAVRCEFQLRREALRNFFIKGGCEGVLTVEDWEKSQNHICKYLTTVWIRLYKEQKNWQHSERLTDDDMLPEWIEIIEAFDKWTGDGDGDKIMRNVKPPEITADSLAQQGVGCFFSAFIRQGQRIMFKAEDAFEQFLTLCTAQLCKWWDEHSNEAEQIQAAKELRYNSKTPIDIQTPLACL